MGFGFMLYAQSWDDSFPLSYNVNYAMRSKWGQKFQTWMDATLPYVKSYTAYTCPARYNDGVPFGWGPTGNTGIWSRSVGYSMNSYMKGYTPAGVIMRISGFKNPAHKIIVNEMMYCVPDSGFWYLQWYLPYVAAKHGGKTNFIFGDGHAQTMTPSQSIAPTPQCMWNVADSYPMVVDPSNGTTAANAKEAQAWLLGRWQQLFPAGAY